MIHSHLENAEPFSPCTRMELQESQIAEAHYLTLKVSKRASP